jgi:hypothetical protein
MTTRVLGGAAFSMELGELLAGDSALSVAAGPSHFAAVTMRKQLFTWHQGRFMCCAWGAAVEGVSALPFLVSQSTLCEF